jgi:hypothetical protein
MAIVTLATGQTIDTDKLTDGSFVRYGRRFRHGVTWLQVELLAFLQGWAAPHGLGKAAHFKRIVEFLWPYYEWNRWSDDMARALCEHDLVAFMGCGGSGKSLFLAMWALINWWAAPQDTTIAITSTDLEAGKRRVWGYIVTLHQSAQWADDNGVVTGPPGKLTDQPPQVRLTEKDGVRGAGQQAINLVAAGNQHVDSAMKALQGLHNKRVILILDELQDLAMSIIGGVLENLGRNEYFQLCAAGNIGDANDPLGVLCRPVTPTNLGYDDVNAEVQSWDILSRSGKAGVCVRFDAEYSPNFDDYNPNDPAWHDKYPFLPRVSEVAAKKLQLEQGMLELGDYYRQWKAFITPKNIEDGRWSPAAILRFQAEIAAEWATLGGYVTLAGADPSYTSGGDRFILYPMRYGLINSGLWVLEFQEPLSLQHDMNDSELRNFAMVRQVKKICQDLKIESQYFGCDISGENPLGDIIASEWNNEFLRVSFLGKPSSMPASLTDGRPCSEVYGNKCAELWCVGADFLRCGQLRGIGKVHASELAARKIFRGTRNKICVEDKKVMKKRIRMSPDVADAGNVGLEVARVRLGAVAGAMGTQARMAGWQEVAKKMTVSPIRLNSARGIQTFVRR